jgi:hypothetical protein
MKSCSLFAKEPCLFRFKAAVARIGAFALVLICPWSAWAQDYRDFINVTSTTDGNGLFSYTFSPGNGPFLWCLTPTSGNFYIQSHGILEVISPPGWAATVDLNEGISWRPTSGSIFVGQPPVTFSIRSMFTDSVVYDEWPPGSTLYTSGVLGGAMFTLPDLQNANIGLVWFPVIGPQIIPEPSSSSLAVVVVAAWFLRRRLCTRVINNCA